MPLAGAADTHSGKPPHLPKKLEVIFRNLTCLETKYFTMRSEFVSFSIQEVLTNYLGRKRKIKYLKLFYVEA